MAIMIYLNKQGRPVRQHDAPLGKVLVAREQYTRQHALVEEAVTHPFGDDDVNLANTDVHVLHLALFSTVREKNKGQSRKPIKNLALAVQRWRYNAA